MSQIYIKNQQAGKPTASSVRVFLKSIIKTMPSLTFVIMCSVILFAQWGRIELMQHKLNETRQQCNSY
jgi:hypothetical protein